MGTLVRGYCKLRREKLEKKGGGLQLLTNKNKIIDLTEKKKSYRNIGDRR